MLDVDNKFMVGLLLPFRKVPLTTQTFDQPVRDPSCPDILAATVSRLSGRRDTASPGSSRT